MGGRIASIVAVALGVMAVLFGYRPGGPFAFGVTRPQSPISSPKASDEPLIYDRTADPGSIRDAHFLDISGDELLKILDDPEKRVDPEFRVPNGIRDIVGFWLKVYAKYSLYHTIVYDRENHRVVYDIVDNRELFQKGLSPVVLEISAKKRINRVVGEYKAAFRQLIRNPRKRFRVGTAGSNILRAWGRKSSSEWKRILRNLRTQTGQRDRTMYGLATADRFLPAMESVFKKFGIPHQITRLPLVESSFNIHAHSKAAAVGVWQFMERSALEYLVVDRHNKIDERLSPIKSTYAAARMFRRNYRLLEDWGLAIIAYNHGPRNLIPIRNRYRKQKISKLLRKTTGTPLGYASRSFYACFLAMLHAERYRDRLYGIPKTSRTDAISIVRIKKPASVFEVAAKYNISIHELRVYNPDVFDIRRRLPAGTRIVLPRKHGESLVEAPILKLDGKNRPESRGIASEVEFIEYIRMD